MSTCVKEYVICLAFEKSNKDVIKKKLKSKIK